MYVHLLDFWAKHPEVQAANIHVAAKGVPDFVQFAGPEFDEWLPPPVAFDETQHVRLWRAVLLVPSNTPLEGVRFRRILASYTGAAWATVQIEEVFHTLEDAIIDEETAYVGWQPAEG